MAYDFNSQWSLSGLSRQVTTQTLVRNGPGAAPASQPLVRKGPGQKAVSQPLQKGGGAASHFNFAPNLSMLIPSMFHRRYYDHIGQFNFIVDIDGMLTGAFKKCDGLSFEIDEVTYRSTTDAYERKRPGLYRHGSIKLTKGYTCNDSLWKWCKTLMDGEVKRRNGAVHLLDDDAFMPLVTFEFYDAFPTKWSGFALDSDSSGNHIETMELSIERLKMIKWPNAYMAGF